MKAWCYIILEGYCSFRTLSEKEHKGRTVESFELMKFGKVCTIENKNYISKEKRPKWCRAYNKKRIPQYKCFRSDCPFFSYTDAEKKVYESFFEVYDKQGDEE